MECELLCKVIGSGLGRAEPERFRAMVASDWRARCFAEANVQKTGMQHFQVSKYSLGVT
jgi:hypothetical protein